MKFAADGISRLTIPGAAADPYPGYSMTSGVPGDAPGVVFRLVSSLKSSRPRLRELDPELSPGEGAADNW